MLIYMHKIYAKNNVYKKLCMRVPMQHTKVHVQYNFTIQITYLIYSSPDILQYVNSELLWHENMAINSMCVEIIV